MIYNCILYEQMWTLLWLSFKSHIDNNNYYALVTEQSQRGDIFSTVYTIFEDDTFCRWSRAEAFHAQYLIICIEFFDDEEPLRNQQSARQASG